MGKQASEKTKQPEERNWSLLMYIAADNDLSDAGLEDIEEMCKEGAAKDDVYVGIEIDTSGDHNGSIRYEITDPDWTGKAHRTVIKRLKEKDSGNPKTLGKFVKWGLGRYRAKNRLLVMWGHGLGFRTRQRDTGYDYDTGSSLSMPEIERALKAGGIKKGKKVQILGFDACLMNMLEVVHHFKDQAEIVVGAQQTEPWDGWPYNKVIAAAKGGKTPEEVAYGIVEAYYREYDKQDRVDITQSAVSTVKTQDVVDALSDLGKALKSKLDSISQDINTIRTKVQTFEAVDYVDLIHLMKLISQDIGDEQLKNKAEEVIKKVKSSVICNKTNMANAYGLSVWFPPAKLVYLENRAKYLQLNCNRSQFGWTEFLEAYYNR